MSSHYHVVLRLDPKRALGCSEAEVLERWKRLFSLPLLINRYRNGHTSCAAEGQAAREGTAGAGAPSLLCRNRCA